MLNKHTYIDCCSSTLLLKLPQLQPQNAKCKQPTFYAQKCETLLHSVCMGTYHYLFNSGCLYGDTGNTNKNYVFNCALHLTKKLFRGDIQQICTCIHVHMCTQLHSQWQICCTVESCLQLFIYFVFTVHISIPTCYSIQMHNFRFLYYLYIIIIFSL